MPKRPQNQPAENAQFSEKKGDENAPKRHSKLLTIFDALLCRTLCFATVRPRQASDRGRPIFPPQSDQNFLSEGVPKSRRGLPFWLHNAPPYITPTGTPIGASQCPPHSKLLPWLWCVLACTPCTHACQTREGSAICGAPGSVLPLLLKPKS